MSFVPPPQRSERSSDRRFSGSFSFFDCRSKNEKKKERERGMPDTKKREFHCWHRAAVLNSRAVFQTKWIFCRPVFKSHKTNEKWPAAQKSSWLQPTREQMAQLASLFAIHVVGGRWGHDSHWLLGLDYRDQTQTVVNWPDGLCRA